MLSGITFTCFVANYAMALALEESRLFFRMPVRLVVLIAFAAAGLFAQTLFLCLHACEYTEHLFQQAVMQFVEGFHRFLTQIADLHAA